MLNSSVKFIETGKRLSHISDKQKLY